MPAEEASWKMGGGALPLWSLFDSQGSEFLSLSRLCSQLTLVPSLGHWIYKDNAEICFLLFYFIEKWLRSWIWLPPLDLNRIV